MTVSPTSLTPSFLFGAVFMVVFFTFLAIAAVVTTVIWFVAVAVYQALLGGPDLRQKPIFALASCESVFLVTLLTLVPFPFGFLLTLGVWWFAARNILELPFGRAALLFLILAGLTFVARLAILGVLAF